MQKDDWGKHHNRSPQIPEPQSHRTDENPAGCFCRLQLLALPTQACCVYKAYRLKQCAEFIPSSPLQVLHPELQAVFLRSHPL